MTTADIIRLVLQVLVFIAWAFMMYKMLLTLRQRNQDETGGLFPSTGGFLAQFGYWMKSDEDKMDRKTLVFLTFVLIAMNVINIVMAPG